MTQRHFEALAALLRDSGDAFKSNTRHALHASDVAALCASFNPRFDRARFIAAAMPRWMVGTRHETAWQRVAAAAVGCDVR